MRPALSIRSMCAALSVLMVSAIFRDEARATAFWPVDAQPEVITTYGEYQDYPEMRHYLHDGLDICAPARAGVKSISKGRIAFFHYGLTTYSDRGEEFPIEPFCGPQFQVVIVEDRDAGGTPLGVGWLYGHISVASIWRTAFKRDVVGVDLEAGSALTTVWDFEGGPDHVHVCRVRKGIAGWTDQDPRIENPLRFFVESGVITSDPVIPVITAGNIRVYPDENSGSYGQHFPTHDITLPDSPPDPEPVVFGKVDILARPLDSFLQSYPPGDDHCVGVDSIGFRLEKGWTSSTPIGDRIVRGFEGEIRNMTDSTIAKTIYRVSEHFPSLNDWAWYVASNYHPLLGWANWSSGAADACWNTRMRGSGLPWLAPDAQTPGEAVFPDGVYRVTVMVSDVLNASEASIPVIVDNWAPYVKEVMVWKDGEGGEPGEPDPLDWVIYHGRWQYDQPTGANVLSVLHQEASTDAAVQIRLTFSEDMDVYGGPVVYLGEAVQSREVEGEWASGSVTVWQGEATGEVFEAMPTGRHVILVYARDLVQNRLDETPATVAARSASGGWAEAGYDPTAVVADTTHGVIVAPALWAVERSCGGGHQLVGYRADGTSLRIIDLAGWTPGRVRCSADPVDGGCWVYGECGIPDMQNLVKYSASGGVAEQVEAVAEGPEGGGPIWVGTEHHPGPWIASEGLRQETVWALRVGPGSSIYDLFLTRYHRATGTQWMTTVETVGHYASPGFGYPHASIDQHSGDVWVIAWADPPGWTDDPTTHLFRFTSGNLREGRESIVRALQVEVEGAGGRHASASGRTVVWWGHHFAVSASPVDHSAWVSVMTWAPHGGFEQWERFEVRRYSAGGTYTTVWDQWATFGPADNVIGRTAVCAFQDVSGCAATWLASQECNWPDPEVSCDDAMAVIRNQSVHSHNIVIPCYTRCGDEYINGLFMSASPRLGGAWWVRPHMSPPNDGFCQDQESRNYVVDFRFARQHDAGDAIVFTRTFPGCGPFSSWYLDTMSEYGVTGITGCAGALWEWPEEESGRPLAAEDSEVTADADTSTPRVFEYRLGSTRPNPCTGCPGVTIEYSLAGVSTPQFELYNLAGQRVRSILPGAKPAGAYTTSWDVLDFTGKRVPPATYILQMRAEGFVGRTPVVVIR